MKQETLYEIWQRDPLESFKAMVETRQSYWYPSCAFVWQVRAGKYNPKVGYGSYRWVSLLEVLQRKPEIQFFDGAPVIVWLDEAYNEITHKKERAT